MEKIKRAFFFILGFISLGMAYVGVVTPGIPYSPFIVFSAYCFSKSSKRMENWIYNHKIFGPFLLNWETKKVFPTKMKYFMLFMMTTSLLIIWFTTGKIILLLSVAAVMALVATWACRFPGSVDEYERRRAAGIRVGRWF